jgi:hypothetical protein
MAKRFKANAYITKPINQTMVNAMLDKYVCLNDLKQNLECKEDFFDLDSFEDFDDLNNIDEFNSENIDMIDDFNESHKQISAKEFLSEYDNLDYILLDISDLDDDIYELVDTLEFNVLVENISNIIAILDSYSAFLNTFSSFYELATSLNILSNLLSNTDFTKFDNKNLEFITNFIKAIFKDLQDWKEHVFILQDAVDVFYINASSLNSCIQLENYIKKNLNR